MFSLIFFKWYLNLLSLSNKIKRVTFYYNILLEETGTKRRSSTWFDHSSYSDGWDNSHLPTLDIKDLNSFTFYLDVRLFDIYQDDKFNINRICVEIELHQENNSLGWVEVEV